MTVKPSEVGPLTTELSRKEKKRSCVDLIQQIPLSPLSGSGTVAMDFVIPVAWRKLVFRRRYILTAAKLKQHKAKASALPKLDVLRLLARFWRRI